MFLLRNTIVVSDADLNNRRFTRFHWSVVDHARRRMYAHAGAMCVMFAAPTDERLYQYRKSRSVSGSTMLCYTLHHLSDVFVT